MISDVITTIYIKYLVKSIRFMVFLRCQTRRCERHNERIRKLPVLARVSFFFMVSGFPDSSIVWLIQLAKKSSNPLLKLLFDSYIMYFSFSRVPYFPESRLPIIIHTKTPNTPKFSANHMLFEKIIEKIIEFIEPNHTCESFGCIKEHIHLM